MTTKASTDSRTKKSTARAKAVYDAKQADKHGDWSNPERNDMSIELEQLANLVEIAEHDRTLDYRCDYLETITEHIDTLKAILARMQAMENAMDHAFAAIRQTKGTP